MCGRSVPLKNDIDLAVRRILWFTGSPTTCILYTYFKTHLPGAKTHTSVNSKVVGLVLLSCSRSSRNNFTSLQEIPLTNCSRL